MEIVKHINITCYGRGSGGHSTTIAEVSFDNKLTDKEFKHAVLTARWKFHELVQYKRLMVKYSLSYTDAVKKFLKSK
jgi:hypothetical protein